MDEIISLQEQLNMYEFSFTSSSETIERAKFSFQCNTLWLTRVIKVLQTQNRHFKKKWRFSKNYIQKRIKPIEQSNFVFLQHLKHPLQVCFSFCIRSTFVEWLLV